MGTLNTLYGLIFFWHIKDINKLSTKNDQDIISFREGDIQDAINMVNIMIITRLVFITAMALFSLIMLIGATIGMAGIDLGFNDRDFLTEQEL